MENLKASLDHGQLATINPFRHFDNETGARLKQTRSHLKQADTAPEQPNLQSRSSRLLSALPNIPVPSLSRFWSSSKEAPAAKPDRASEIITSIYRRGYDVVGSLCCFATLSSFSSDDETALISLKDAIKLMRKASALSKVSNEGDDSAPTIDPTSMAFARHCVADSRESIDAEYFKKSNAELSLLDFDRELNASLLQLAQAISGNKRSIASDHASKKDGLSEEGLRAIESIISTFGINSKKEVKQLRQKLLEMNKQELVNFLKKNWPPVKILQNFRIALLTDGIDCESSLSQYELPQLIDLWENLGRNYDSLIAHYSKASLNTKDIAHLLQKRKELVRIRLIEKIIEDDEILSDFIKNNVSKLPTNFDLQCEGWANVFNVRFKLLHQNLSRHHLVPSIAETLSLSRNILRLWLKNLPVEKQDQFFAKLSLQELYHLKFANCLLMLAPASQIHRDIDETTRRIDLAIRKRAEQLEPSELEVAQTQARVSALSFVTAHLVDDLLALGVDAEGENADVSALYSYIRKKAAIYVQKLITAEVIPGPLNEGADYATGLIMSAFCIMRRGDTKPLETIASKLSVDQLATLSHAIPHPHWITAKFADLQKWNETASIFNRHAETKSAIPLLERQSGDRSADTAYLSSPEVKAPGFYVNSSAAISLLHPEADKLWHRTKLSSTPYGRYHLNGEPGQRIPVTTPNAKKGDSKIPLQITELSSLGDDVIGSLFSFATRGVSSLNETETTLEWDDAIAFSKQFLTTMQQVRKENPDNKNLTQITTADMARFRAIECLNEMTPQQRDRLRLALSSINFEHELDGALGQIVQSILLNRSDRKALEDIANTLYPSLDLTNPVETIVTMDGIELFHFLKNNWIPVTVLINFRKALLTGGLDSATSLSKASPEKLLALWDLHRSTEMQHLIAWYGKPGLYTQDIANLLQRRTEQIHTRNVLAKIDLEKELIAFIDSHNSVDDQCIFADKPKEQIGIWQIIVGSRLRNLHATLKESSLISPDMHYSTFEREITKVSLAQLGKDYQLRFLEKLPFNELLHFKLAGCLVTLASASSLQRDLDSINRLIDLQIGMRSADSDQETIEELKQAAQKQALIDITAQVTRDLVSIATLASSNSEVDIPAMYSRLHRNVESSFAGLVSRGFVEQSDLKDDTDYASGILLGAFLTLHGLDEKDDTSHLAALTSRLSFEQLANLASGNSEHFFNTPAASLLTSETASAISYFRGQVEQRKNTSQSKEGEKFS